MRYFVVAIEPDPDHLPLLRANIALNKLDDRVTVVEAAIWDRCRLRQPFIQGSRRSGVSRWMMGRVSEEPPPDAIAVEPSAPTPWSKPVS